LAVAGYWLSVVCGVLLLLVAFGFVVLSPEELVYRFLSVVFLGVIPGLAAWATGWMLFWILTITASVCDLVTRLLLEIFRIPSDIFVLWFSKDVVSRCVRAIKIVVRIHGYGRERLVAAAALYFAVTVRGSIVAYRNFLMAVTFPVRLLARILIVIIQGEYSAV